LSDPKKRAEYDQFGSSPFGAGGPGFEGFRTYAITDKDRPLISGGSVTFFPVSSERE
jgi:DnaJ-class molecular chaperone